MKRPPVGPNSPQLAKGYRRRCHAPKKPPSLKPRNAIVASRRKPTAAPTAAYSVSVRIDDAPHAAHGRMAIVPKSAMISACMRSCFERRGGPSGRGSYLSSVLRSMVIGGKVLHAGLHLRAQGASRALTQSGSYGSHRLNCLCLHPVGGSVHACSPVET